MYRERKVNIEEDERVYYRSKHGHRVIGKVHKVNRVNSKVEALAIGDQVVFRSNILNTVDVYKGYLRRATPKMIELVFEVHLNPNMQ
jgi:hypothetical protein